MGRSPRDAAADLDRLQKFFARLLADEAYAKVSVTVQHGAIAVVYVDRTYRIDQLPIGE